MMLAVVVLILALIVAACGQGGSAGASVLPSASEGPASEAPPSDPPIPSATAAVASAAGSASSSAVTGVDAPPDALLAAEGGDPVLGQLGTFVWLDGGSDAPWLSGSPITVGAGEPLSVRFEPYGAIAGWRARYVPAGRTDPQGAQSLGEGTGAPAFPAPAPGSWTAEVTVDFGQNVGSASYFWRLDVQ